MTLEASPKTILAVSGSLRSRSSNSRLLEMAASLAPANLRFVTSHHHADLPHFNPDIDREEDKPPPAVAAWREAIRTSDALVISCPEYAHGVPGSFKNALDWLVSSADLLEKPVLLLNASSSGGEFAQASLVETLRMLGANVLEGHSLVAPFLPATTWKDGPDARSTELLRASMVGLASVLTGD